ncbi:MULTISPECIES: PQQ-binding-like beta-propeller repeat protein [unclassified Haladaptatus]|uniref:PQQ-binding-like beta-propeller repeat protein n=1 Tax=unclassified Haladaptatus TaxID=2622732 RepID=UPI0023E87E27|nr:MULTISPECIES: PQQ-binding-like beta-propeller repeat protein [unclassified Haladaptatus]
MQPSSRRSFLATVAGASAALAGCSANPLPEPVSEVWSAEISGGSPVGKLAFTSDTVVTGSEYDGQVHLIDRETGDVTASYDFDDSTRHGSAVWFGPYVVDDVVLVAAELRILAMDFDGTEVWERTFDETELIEFHLFEDMALIGTKDGALEAVAATTGEQVWESDAVSHTEIRDYATDGTRAFFAAVTEVIVIDPADGSKLWTSEVGLDSFVGASSDAVVAVGEGSATAFDPATGEQVWDRETDYNPSRSPLVDSQVYLWGQIPAFRWSKDPDGAGPMTALDVETGAVQWRSEEHTIHFVDVTEGNVYALSADDALVKFAADGTEQWSANLDNRPIKLTVVSQSEMYVFDDRMGTLRRLEYSG